MTEHLQVDPGGVRSLGGIHADVAASLGQLSASSPGPAAVSGSHGTIAAAVDTALTGALGSRSGTMSGAQSAGASISELLHQAALAYERGDEQGGDAIRAAADALSGGQAPAGTGGVATPAGSGADALGQAVGQMGQLGQMGQQLAAPLAALAQPLQQLPQQLMQGMQQMAQTSSGATGADKAQIPGSEMPAGGERDERAPRQDGEGETPPEEEVAPDSGAEEGTAESLAEEGTSTGAGPAPLPPPQERPAPTRPSIG